MEITNYTRYNTDDIRAILARIEKESTFTGWRNGMASLTISEFNPSNPYVTVRSGPSNRAVQVKRYVSKTMWARPGQMSILTPGKIYENPLQELVQEGEKEVPKDMVQAVAASLWFRAHRTTWSANAPNYADMRIRVMKKAAEKKPKNEKSAVEARDTFAKRNVQIVEWASTKAHHEVKRLAKKHLGVAGTHLKDRKHLVQPLLDAVADAESALDRVTSIARSLSAAI
jgi:hypothetical protein